MFLFGPFDAIDIQNWSIGGALASRCQPSLNLARTFHQEVPLARGGDVGIDVTIIFWVLARFRNGSQRRFIRWFRFSRPRSDALHSGPPVRAQRAGGASRSKNCPLHNSSHFGSAGIVCRLWDSMKQPIPKYKQARRMHSGLPVIRSMQPSPCRVCASRRYAAGRSGATYCSGSGRRAIWRSTA